MSTTKQEWEEIKKTKSYQRAQIGYEILINRDLIKNIKKLIEQPEEQEHIAEHKEMITYITGEIAGLKKAANLLGLKEFKKDKK